MFIARLTTGARFFLGFSPSDDGDDVSSREIGDFENASHPEVSYSHLWSFSGTLESRRDCETAMDNSKTHVCLKSSQIARARECTRSRRKSPRSIEMRRDAGARTGIFQAFAVSANIWPQRGTSHCRDIHCECGCVPDLPQRSEEFSRFRRRVARAAN